VRSRLFVPGYRRRHPELPRFFKTPGVPLVPILGILVSAYLMYDLPGAIWWLLVIRPVLGMFVYFGYGRTHSRVVKSGNGIALEPYVAKNN
jgi:APA family basic amino acid/polyamine antiporter